jgi:hypothetical protein
VRLFGALLWLSACGSSEEGTQVTGSVSAGAPAADSGTAGRRAAVGGAAGRAMSTAGSRAVADGGMPRPEAPSDAGAAAAGGGGAGTAGAGTGGTAGAAGSGGSSSVEDAGVDEVDASVSCKGEIVSGPERCLQDDAFCFPLGDGRYCTGPSAPPQPCGARAGDTCKADEYCAYQPGQLCGQADAQAICQPRPSSCSGPGAAVCGCDQRTHASACEANAAGVGIFAEGACR